MVVVLSCVKTLQHLEEEGDWSSDEIPAVLEVLFSFFSKCLGKLEDELSFHTLVVLNSTLQRVL